MAVLAVLAGITWRWGLAGLAVAGGIAVVGGLIVWAVVMPRRAAPPVPTEILDKIADVKGRVEVDDARTRLHHDLRIGALQWLTVLAVVVGAGVGFWQLAQDRDKALKDRQLTRQGQASERFTRAIDQLGSRDRVETRIGGIYGLDQIAEQASENTGPVGEVLLAWLNSRPRPVAPPATPVRERAPDVQAALTVLTGPRYSPIVADRLNLHSLGLREAKLRDAFLGGADLREVDLRDADLHGAKLHDAYLDAAKLDGADLGGADLHGANLPDAYLGGANLDSANLRGVGLRNADLGHSNLRGADMDGVNLRDAYLVGANLDGANLHDAFLRGAKYDKTTSWPAGFDPRRVGARLVHS